jgi:hypothetical protein
MTRKLFVMSVMLGALVLVAGITPAPIPAGGEDQNAPPSGEILLVAPSAADDATCEESAAFLEASSCSPCPNRCFRDRDCDKLCGGKGLGSCVQVNSCCRSCACVA